MNYYEKMSNFIFSLNYLSNSRVDGVISNPNQYRNGLVLLALYGFLFSTESFLTSNKSINLVVIYTKSDSGLFRLYHTLLIQNHSVKDLFYRQEFSNNFYWDLMDAYNDGIGLPKIELINNLDDIIFYFDKNKSSIKDEFHVSIFSLDHMILDYISDDTNND